MTMPMKTNTGAGLRGGGPGDKIPKGYRKGSLSNFDAQQMKLFEQMFGHVGPDSYTGRLAAGDQSMFAQMEAPAMRDFQGGMGQLASRFSGMGQGGRYSSGFQNSATAATSNFAQDLAARRHDMQRQAINDLMGFSNQLLQQRPQDNFMVEKPQKQNYWADIAGKFAGAIPGAIVGGATGGTSGAVQGINSGLSLFGDSSRGGGAPAGGNNMSGRYGLPGRGF